MHSDGTARRQIAGPGARSAVDDVTVLGRFEVFTEPAAYSDLTGSAALVVYDIATGRTVLVSRRPAMSPPMTGCSGGRPVRTY